MEWLKEILKKLEGADSLYDDITKGIGKSFVARSDFNEKLSDLKTANTRIGELENAAGGSENYKEKYETLSVQYEADKKSFADQLAGAKRDYALEAKIAKSGVKNVKAFKALLDMEKITIDGDEIKGYDEQETAIKKSDPYLFDKVTNKQGIPPAIGDPDKEDQSFGARMAQESAKAKNESKESFLSALGITGNK